jgi:hypothetical protein
MAIGIIPAISLSRFIGCFQEPLYAWLPFRGKPWRPKQEKILPLSLPLVDG